MLFERISSEKFTAFQEQQVTDLHQVVGGFHTPEGSRSLGGGSCDMDYESDTYNIGSTTFHGATYSGDDCPCEGQ